jgi:hypothetical protein
MMFGKRDNLFDWSKAPSSPYHPSYYDYQMPGDMKILEIPVTVHKNRQTDTQPRNLYPQPVIRFSNFTGCRIANEVMGRSMFLYQYENLKSKNDIFIISAWRNSFGLEKFINERLADISSRDWLYILGYFHPCEILNPLNGKPNLQFLVKFQTVLYKILTLQEYTHIFPVTVSEFGRKINEGALKL